MCRKMKIENCFYPTKNTWNKKRLFTRKNFREKRPTLGLPDGTFSNQTSKFGKILQGLAMDEVGIFYGPFFYFTVIWYVLLPLVIFCGNLVYISPFWYVAPRKIWQPCCWRQHRYVYAQGESFILSESLKSVFAAFKACE
jgi:hypothetical protein